MSDVGNHAREGRTRQPKHKSGRYDDSSLRAGDMTESSSEAVNKAACGTTHVKSHMAPLWRSIGVGKTWLCLLVRALLRHLRDSLRLQEADKIIVTPVQQQRTEQGSCRIRLLGQTASIRSCDACFLLQEKQSAQPCAHDPAAH